MPLPSKTSAAPADDSRELLPLQKGLPITSVNRSERGENE